MDPSRLTADDRTFLNEAIHDYNVQFGTAYETSALGFEGYYKDISRQLAERTIDLVIVVNMFLTGFDSKTLNTLWVDKSLRTHGLIQAFSRTNQILNSVKTYGNVVCFRDLQEETDEAIALFGNEAAGGLVLLKPYKEYLEDYLEKIGELRARFEPGQMIASEAEQKEFIRQFGKILRLRNILASFDDFEDDDVIGEAEFQDYRSVYMVHRDAAGGRRGEGGRQRRSRLRDRAGQAGGGGSRLSPHAGGEAPRGGGRWRGQGDPGGNPPGGDVQSQPAQQAGPH